MAFIAAIAPRTVLATSKFSTQHTHQRLYHPEDITVVRADRLTATIRNMVQVDVRLLSVLLSPHGPRETLLQLARLRHLANLSNSRVAGDVKLPLEDNRCWAFARLHQFRSLNYSRYFLRYLRSKYEFANCY